jgi:hypothetical protein
LQEVADILADPSPPASLIEALVRRNHLPHLMFTIDASELVYGAMTPGFWWWLGVEPQHTLLCSQPHLYRYLHRRQERSVHDIPWVLSQLGLLQAMLCKHKEWKYKRLRALLLRYLWDYLPHGRTFAKQPM